MAAIDDLDDVRECLSRLSFAFVGLLGNRLDPETVAMGLVELAGIAHEVGELCEVRARRVRTVHAENFHR
ncbi:hypothetical protein ACFFQW_07785 [Umezawaea endophytica]|uniref:Uncharacterized protein n=1 Tax=Umezawaea endophytica TaxID=1654476 RepID=A0A9X3AGS5_9PSEU|nr:hypothetical protein [Umezawaea endophytica]MCS7480001.1 hypothetical protein [Umezawaea endophytica]